MQDSNKTTRATQNLQTTTNGLFNRSYTTGDLNNVCQYVQNGILADHLLNTVYIILEKSMQDRTDYAMINILVI